ncbi:MAG TPA: DNA polymerase III subunit epsilon [Gammaproteobacteria bacterium]|nr:DNA polymerase III subunit epsilon [Gammaproteobacteria bacterium]
MRQVVLDTETTGLEPAEGHRIIEIGALEIVNRRLSGRSLHHYLQPDREIDEGALAVHGITLERLRDSPRFKDVAAALIDFIRDAEVIIHNAPFDVGFLNHELKLAGGEWSRFENYCTVLDTLVMARERHPGQRNSLDALCKRYNVDNSARRYHGALLDAEILADVYLAMTGGQAALLLEDQVQSGARAAAPAARNDRPPLKVISPTDAELAEHQRRLAVIDKVSGGRCLWLHEEGS